MVNGLHILIQNRTKKPLSGAGSELRGREGGEYITNVQYEPLWNCRNDTPPQQIYPNFKKSRYYWIKSSV
jgi:hypothetical protein